MLMSTNPLVAKQLQNISKNDIKTFCKTYLATNLSSSITYLPFEEKEKAINGPACKKN